MRKYLCIIILCMCSGCIVNDPDRFQIGGEVKLETSGVMDYITGFKFRVFGGIVIERKKDEAKNGEEEQSALDIFIDDVGND